LRAAAGLVLLLRRHEPANELEAHLAFSMAPIGFLSPFVD